jgi:hypothetical protein
MLVFASFQVSHLQLVSGGLNATGGKGGKGKGKSGGKGGSIGIVKPGNTRVAPYSSNHTVGNTRAKGGPGGGMQGGIHAQLMTARAIASAPSHPKKKEVSELLSARDKGWVDEVKFGQVLQGLLF